MAGVALGGVALSFGALATLRQMGYVAFRSTLCDSISRRWSIAMIAGGGGIAFCSLLLLSRGGTVPPHVLPTPLPPPPSVSPHTPELDGEGRCCAVVYDGFDGFTNLEGRVGHVWFRGDQQSLDRALQLGLNALLWDPYDLERVKKQESEYECVITGTDTGYAFSSYSAWWSRQQDVTPEGKSLHEAEVAALFRRSKGHIWVAGDRSEIEEMLSRHGCGGQVQDYSPDQRVRDAMNEEGSSFAHFYDPVHAQTSPFSRDSILELRAGSITAWPSWAWWVRLGACSRVVDLEQACSV